MTRTPRFEEPGLLLHTIAQGINRERIVRDDVDRRCFVDRAINVFQESGVETLVWALLDNHVHFGLMVTEGALGKPMQRLLGPHAMCFNRRHGRAGPLMRGRYFSKPVEDEDYLFTLIGYILLNPLRAGIVRDLIELRNYPWSSLSELCYPERHQKTLLTTGSFIPLFGTDRFSAVEGVLSMLALHHGEDPAGVRFEERARASSQVLSPRAQVDVGSVGTQALIMRSDKIEAALKDRESRASTRLILDAHGWTLGRCIAHASEIVGVDERAVARGSRRRPACRARAIAAHLAHAYLGVPDRQIARRIGTSAQAVPRCRARGARALKALSLDASAFFEVASDGLAGRQLDGESVC